MQKVVELILRVNACFYNKHIMAQQSVPSETRRSKRDRNHPPQTTVPSHTNESRTPQNRPGHLNEPEPSDGSHSGNHLGNDTFNGVAADNAMPSGSQDLPSLQSQSSTTAVPPELYTMYRNARLCQWEEECNAELAKEVSMDDERE